MIVLDTDTLTLFFRNHPKVTARLQSEPDTIAITIITRIEVLRGRFDSLFKAADGADLQRGQERLAAAERDLGRVPLVLTIDTPDADEFDRLRKIKSLKKIGRGDLLIASIVLARKATLITRNTKDFGQIARLKIQDWSV